MNHLNQLGGFDGEAMPEFTPVPVPDLGDLSDLTPELPDLSIVAELPDVSQFVSNLPDAPELLDLAELNPELPDLAELVSRVPDLAELERVQEEVVRELEQAQEEADKRLDGLLEMAQPGSYPSAVVCSSRFFLRWWLKYLQTLRIELCTEMSEAECDALSFVEDAGEAWDAGLARGRDLSLLTPAVLRFLGASIERAERERDLMEVETLISHLRGAVAGTAYAPELLQSEEGQWWFANWLDEEAGEVFACWQSQEAVRFDA